MRNTLRSIRRIIVRILTVTPAVLLLTSCPNLPSPSTTSTPHTASTATVRGKAR